MSKINHDASQNIARQLAACTPAEALSVFELIKNDFMAAQVFFQFGREMSRIPGAMPLCTLSIAKLLRRSRLGSGDGLLACLESINLAFQQVCSNPSAVLFGFDRAGNIIMHAATRDSVRHIWQALVTTAATREHGGSGHRDTRAGRPAAERAARPAWGPRPIGDLRATAAGIALDQVQTAGPSLVSSADALLRPLPQGEFHGLAPR